MKEKLCSLVLGNSFFILVGIFVYKYVEDTDMIIRSSK